MAKNSSSTPYAPEETEGAREANRQYQAALAKLTQSLDQRKNRFFDPVWLAAAQGFATPGVTDFFGSLGHVAGNISKAQEGLVKEDQAIAQQQLELAGRGVELERQKARDAMAREYMNRDADRPTGALPAASDATSGALTQARGDSDDELGIQIAPGIPGISRREFFSLGIADGKNMSDLAKDWEAIQRGRVQARENSLFNTATGMVYTAPTGNTVEVQIFNRDGTPPKTYKVPANVAAELSVLARKNNAERYFALAELITQGPKMPSARPVAPAASQQSAVPAAPTVSAPPQPVAVSPSAPSAVARPTPAAAVGPEASIAQNLSSFRNTLPIGTKDIFGGQLSQEDKQRIEQYPGIKDLYETYSQNAAFFLNTPPDDYYYRNNVHLLAEQAKKLSDFTGVKLPGTVEELRQVLNIGQPAAQPPATASALAPAAAAPVTNATVATTAQTAAPTVAARPAPAAAAPTQTAPAPTTQAAATSVAAPSAAAQAAPSAPGRAAASGATRPAGLPTVEESESRKAREKALQEADVQMEIESRKDFNQRFRDAGDSITMANMLRRFSEDPNASKMTGILNNEKISSGIARLVRDGVGARDFRIGIPAIEDVMRNAGLSPADQAKYRVFLMNTAQMRLQMSKYMKGSVSNYEQELMGEAAVSSQDTPQTIRMKADLLARRAQFDRKVYRAFKAAKMTAEEFLDSDQYEKMRDEYDEQLTRISVGELRYKPSTSNPPTNAPARGAPAQGGNAGNAAAGDRLRELLNRPPQRRP